MLRAETSATSLLCDGTAVIVVADVTQLFGIDGVARRAVLGGDSPVVLSAEDRTFRYVNRDGYLVARSLEDGAERWSCAAPIGGAASYGVHLSKGTATLIGGSRIDVDPEAEAYLPEFALEWMDPGADPEVLRGDILADAGRSPKLLATVDGELLGASDGTSVVITLDGYILHLKMDLSVERVRTARFTPRAISMGAQGRAYLVVDTPDGAALWMLNALGERVFTAPLPDATSVPPTITADHRIFVTTDAEILAFSPVGRLLWRVASPTKPPRASATADGWLLVSLGEELRAFDAEGRSAVLSYSVGRPFVTAPVITTHGEILVATTETLVCLSYEALTYAAGYQPA
jgi:outer membrane protein assembly factor BamB